MTSWRYAVSTDVGLVRELNEDSVFADGRLAIVADGMGGHAAGEIASAIAIDQMRTNFLDRGDIEDFVRAVEAANRAIIADADTNPERLGMGTTVVSVGLVATENGTLPVVVNVGDSRAYQLRDGALRQLTADHSVAEEWVRQGRLTADEAAVHPRRHQLTRTLGIETNVRPDAFPVAANAGDRLLLCSDGLSNELTADVIAELASAPHTLEESVALLVAQANRHGGRDNISAVLIEFDVVSAQPPANLLDDLASPAFASARPQQAGRPLKRGSSFFTWRSGLFVVALLGAIASIYVVFYWYAKSSYFLGSYRSSPASAAYVAIYEGQPGGLLWFKPTLVVITPYIFSDLTVADRKLVNADIVEPSAAAALIHAKNLDDHGRQVHTGTTTTTTTVTSTTVAKPKG